MKIQKKQAIGENLLYVMVGTAISLVPFLNSQMMSEMHVNLENVLTAWRYIAPYLIIFLIHNAIIAPRYILRRNYGKYLATNLSMIIIVLSLVKIYDDHHQDHLLQQNDPDTLAHTSVEHTDDSVRVVTVDISVSASDDEATDFDKVESNIRILCQLDDLTTD